MTPTPEQLITAARAYLGAPFRHQGWDATGMDCRGLLLRSACDVGLFSDSDMAEAKDLQIYGREPDGRMAGLLKRYAELVPDADNDNPDRQAETKMGDILAIKFIELPQHLALVTRVTKFARHIIHATEPGGVIEHRLDVHWLRSHRARVHGVYRLKAFL